MLADIPSSGRILFNLTAAFQVRNNFWRLGAQSVMTVHTLAGLALTRIDAWTCVTTPLSDVAGVTTIVGSVT